MRLVAGGAPDARPGPGQRHRAPRRAGQPVSRRDFRPAPTAGRSATSPAATAPASTGSPLDAEDRPLAAGRRGPHRPAWSSSFCQGDPPVDGGTATARCRHVDRRRARRPPSTGRPRSRTAATRSRLLDDISESAGIVPRVGPCRRRTLPAGFRPRQGRRRPGHRPAGPRLGAAGRRRRPAAIVLLPARLAGDAADDPPDGSRRSPRPRRPTGLAGDACRRRAATVLGTDEARARLRRPAPRETAAPRIAAPDPGRRPACRRDAPRGGRPAAAKPRPTTSSS